MKYLPLNITNETNQLKTVILGIGTDQGKPYEINPVAKMHKEKGTYPSPEDIQAEIAEAKATLEKAGVTVIQPQNLPNKKQIFTRDIGFVIDDKFVVANMKEPLRHGEIDGIQFILNQINPNDIIRIPESATIEGGDVLIHGNHVLVGISKRTNLEGFEFLKSQFPYKQFHALDLVVSDDPNINILHLDCAFQPVGDHFAIFYEQGFKNRPEIIYTLFDEENLIRVSQEEKNAMFPNVFSITPTDVLIEKSFTRLIVELEVRGINCHPVKYNETSKLSGLLRCSTLPLIRE
ncbi:MAG TPA: arginine deiminase family protein [Roseivirga sp.]